jgi:hypothetical protein
VRLARFAGGGIEESGVTALAAALPQMPSLKTLSLRGSATRSRCGFLYLRLAHRWLGGSSRRVRRRAGARSDVGRRAFWVGAAVRLARLAGISWFGDSGVTALTAALLQMPSLTTLDLKSTATRARCGFPVAGACASVVGRLLAPGSSGCGHAVGGWAAGLLVSEWQ